MRWPNTLATATDRACAVVFDVVEATHGALLHSSRRNKSIGTSEDNPRNVSRSAVFGQCRRDAVDGNPAFLSAIATR
jgi:hypothetical protein